MIGLARKRFIETKARCSLALGAVVEKFRVETGEDEELITSGHFELEAQHAVGGMNDGEEIHGMGDPTGHGTGARVRTGSEFFQQHTGNVIGEFSVIDAAIEECMADEHIEIE